MTNKTTISAARDGLLFTPGPLTTSRTVKQAMLQDLGSRDTLFLEAVQDIRQRLLRVADLSADDYTTVLMQGSGTFGIESVIGSVIPPAGKLLAVTNGAYGRRIEQIARVLRIDYCAVSDPEDAPSDLDQVRQALADDPAITHIAAVHCETTSGLINPIEAIGSIANAAGKTFIVDAMSSFGAIPLDIAAAGIDYLISSANKCIEGVPGFAFVLARRDTLVATEGWARSLSLDLLAQWRELERSRQFRFTPPTHTLLAFRQALLELEAEGGVVGRAARYRANYATLIAGMRALGFQEYLQPERQSYIITSFVYPNHPRFDFATFYALLHDRGYIIYPGKVGNADCFRIGTIGRIFEADVRGLLGAIQATLEEMGVALTPVLEA